MSIAIRNKYLLFGGGGHAKSVIAMLKERSLSIAGIIDKSGPAGSPIAGVSVVSSEDTVAAEDYPDCFSLVTVGSAGANNRKRMQMYESLKGRGFLFGPVITGRAIVSPSATFGDGTIILEGCIVNCEVSVGVNCILNTGCIVEHDTVVSDHTHISCGAIVCGTARIGRNVFIGAGATILQGVTIGDNSVVGAGATVIHPVDENCVAVGTPAKVIHRNNRV